MLVVLERNPWLDVIGSDSPTFALYDDGTIVYANAEPAPDARFFTRKVADAKKLTQELVPFDIASLAARHELSTATDQITTVLWTPSKQIVIYGDWRKPRDTDGSSHPEMQDFVAREKKLWESFPVALRQALLRVDEQRKLAGSPWLPRHVEVMFWPYEYAPDESITWPRDWPGLRSKGTKTRGEGSYSVYLPSAKLVELRRFLATRKERGAVSIDGKKMAAAYRFPFPGEAAWMR
jgi:hypothetical protein